MAVHSFVSLTDISRDNVIIHWNCANIVEGTYTNLDSITYYTPSLYGIAYCS